MDKLKPALLLASAVVALGVGPAYAHGIGDRYDLPLPLSFFVVGGAAAVVLSFVLVGLVVRGESRAVGYPRFNLFRYSWIEFVLSGPFLWPLKILGVFLLWLVIATALTGTDRPAGNFSPTFIWVVWWVGLGFFVALFGNLWAVVNPWKTLFTWAEGMYRWAFPDKQFGLGREMPAHWGIWPAAILFFCFAWVENSEINNPRDLGWFAVGYSVITWAGMFIFGKQEWLRRGEVFSLVFGLFARFSVTEVRVPSAGDCRECSSPDCRNEDGDCVDCYECFEYAERREFNLRPLGVGLGNAEAIDKSYVALVIMLLASVTFDGFSATPEWFHVQSFFITQFPELTNRYLNGITIANTLGLIGFPLAFLGLYGAFCWLMYRMAGERPPATGALMAGFVLSLIPIALAYHYAHYLGYLLIQGQLIITLASDPFGYGWDLFGTADYTINIRVVTARFIWVFSVLAIVAGHIVAVYLAHIRAMRYYPSRALVLKSQLPMLGLMALYTVVSLWIISRPITE